MKQINKKFMKSQSNMPAYYAIKAKVMSVVETAGFDDTHVSAKKVYLETHNKRIRVFMVVDNLDDFRKYAIGNFVLLESHVGTIYNGPDNSTIISQDNGRDDVYTEVVLNGIAGAVVNYMPDAHMLSNSLETRFGDFEIDFQNIITSVKEIYGMPINNTSILHRAISSIQEYRKTKFHNGVQKIKTTPTEVGRVEGLLLEYLYSRLNRMYRDIKALYSRNDPYVHTHDVKVIKMKTFEELAKVSNPVERFFNNRDQIFLEAKPEMYGVNTPASKGEFNSELMLDLCGKELTVSLNQFENAYGYRVFMRGDHFVDLVIGEWMVKTEDKDTELKDSDNLKDH